PGVAGCGDVDGDWTIWALLGRGATSHSGDQCTRHHERSTAPDSRLVNVIRHAVSSLSRANDSVDHVVDESAFEGANNRLRVGDTDSLVRLETICGTMAGDDNIGVSKQGAF